MAINPTNPDTWPDYAFEFSQDVRLPTTDPKAVNAIADAVRVALTAALDAHPSIHTLRPSALKVELGRGLNDTITVPERGIIKQPIDGITFVDLSEGSAMYTPVTVSA